MTTTQCTVWISRCFLVSSGLFCERRMMCMVLCESFSGESQSVFIAGIRISAVAMKASPCGGNVNFHYPPQHQPFTHAVACKTFLLVCMKQHVLFVLRRMQLPIWCLIKIVL